MGTSPTEEDETSFKTLFGDQNLVNQRHNQDMEIGILPRVVSSIFQRVQNREFDWNSISSHYCDITGVFDDVDPKSVFEVESKVSATFVEIYGDQIRDLFQIPVVSIRGIAQDEPIELMQDADGKLHFIGSLSIHLQSPTEVVECLRRGMSHRTVGSHAMNLKSSRSHAVFTLTMEQHIRRNISQSETLVSDNDQMVITASFTFVDLAGSERQSKTKAQGKTLKEGININKDLLALGNVISALSENPKAHSFVPYRNSLLTRILSESLGGNSCTVMVVCASPDKNNLTETISALEYIFIYYFPLHL